MTRIIQFNVPVLAVVPVQDIYGNPVTNPTPILLDGIQGFDLMLKGSIKQLFADKQFAIAGARGESSVDGKIKAVKQSAEIIASLYTGQGYDTVTAFQQIAAEQKPTYTVPVGTPANVAIVVAAAGAGIALGTGNHFIEDLGVTDGSQNAITRVAFTSSAMSPATGTYAVDLSTANQATYYFNTGDIQGTFVPYLSYLWSTGTPPTGSTAKHLTITNQQGGATPVLQLVAYTSYQGRKCTLVFPWTISSNLNLLATKNLEFSGFEIDFSCFPTLTLDQTILTGYFLE